MARRVRSLHFGNMEGKHVIYHREHRSKRGRSSHANSINMTPYKRNNKKTQKFFKKLRDTYNF